MSARVRLARPTAGRTAAVPQPPRHGAAHRPPVTNPPNVERPADAPAVTATPLPDGTVPSPTGTTRLLTLTQPRPLRPCPRSCESAW